MNFHIFLILIFFLLKYTKPTVLGIDFGTEYTKSSLISPGRSFLILEGTTSKRKSPSSVNFYFSRTDCASKRHKIP